MTTALRLLGAELRNVARTRWVLGYAVLFLLLTDALLRFGGSGSRAVASLTNVIIAVIPLVSIVFGTMHLYHAREFIQLILAQPVGRRSLFAGLYGGLALPLVLAFLLGTGIPFVWHGVALERPAPVLVLLSSGTSLTLVFTALAFVLALRFQDRAAGLGAAILLWFAAAVLYDGLLLIGIATFRDWPLELPVLVATVLNPVDLARVSLLLHFDQSALAGYTGAVLERFFGAGVGTAAASLALVCWVVGPLWIGVRQFVRKDF
jgi:Cu-processing system permease protein